MIGNTVSREIESFYNDYYISKFFTNSFPNFSYDLIIQIFKLLSIEQILLLQSLSQDEYIRSLKIKDITSERLVLSHLFVEIAEDELEEYMQKCQKEFVNSLSNASLYNKTVGNIIPISIEINDTGAFPVKYIEKLLSKAKFHLKLTLVNLPFAECKKLEKFRYASSVSELNLRGIRYHSPKDRDSNLNLSRYVNIQELKEYSESNLSVILSSAIPYKLSSLIINDLVEGNHISRLENLTSLSLHLTDNMDFEIKQLPRSLISLELASGSGFIYISSSNDWPQKLENLVLRSTNLFQMTFHNLQFYKLPPSLRTFDFSVSYPFNILPQLPDLLKVLKVELPSPSSYRDFYSEASLPYLKRLVIHNDFWENDKRIIKFTSELESLKLCHMKFPIPEVDFHVMRFSLKELRIVHYNGDTALENLNFNQFQNLSVIYLKDCKINHLKYFSPPSSLKTLEIYECPISSIEESCPIFKDSSNYSFLTEIKINSCPIILISPNLELPSKLEHLSIVGRTGSLTNCIHIGPSILNHKSLTYLRLGITPSLCLHCFPDKKCQTKLRFLKLIVPRNISSELSSISSKIGKYMGNHEIRRNKVGKTFVITLDFSISRTLF
ncbi:hypothetical protein DFJ63DRAFT_314380 [Scheffersomyces coipomensis]|uniref:uncharacterized protein n=1 Tax=Scheffersomyces coipomensis TaxID=1788519 RepID=UPI00315DB4E6